MTYSVNDAALQLVLRTFAIDPDKIAVAGTALDGGYALFLGRNNTDVFSRVAGGLAGQDLAGTGAAKHDDVIFSCRSAPKSPTFCN